MTESKRKSSLERRLPKSCLVDVLISLTSGPTLMLLSSLLPGQGSSKIHPSAGCGEGMGTRVYLLPFAGLNSELVPRSSHEDSWNLSTSDLM